MLLGIGVQYMTNIPEGNSAGHAVMHEFHPVVAAAPHAMGSPGGSHDLAQIKAANENVNAAIAEAQALLAGHEDEILALATRLDEIRTMGGKEMLFIARQVKEEKRYGPMMLVRVIAPDGTEKRIERRAPGNAVTLSADELPKEPDAANTNEPLPKAT